VSNSFFRAPFPSLADAVKLVDLLHEVLPLSGEEAYLLLEVLGLLGEEMNLCGVVGPHNHLSCCNELLTYSVSDHRDLLELLHVFLYYWV
jgi:hypothetical protein